MDRPEKIKEIFDRIREYEEIWGEHGAYRVLVEEIMDLKEEVENER